MTGAARSLPALLCLGAFALSATLWAAADLGARDAEREFAQSARGRPLSVYAKAGASAPALGGDAAKGWEAGVGVRCAVPISEVKAKLLGIGYAVETVLLAVPEEKLTAAGITLASGRFPRSAWGVELLPDAGAAEMIEKAARAAGAAIPGRVRLEIDLPAAGEDDARAIAASAAIAGVATASQTGDNGAVWADRAALQAWFKQNGIEELLVEMVPITRVDVYMDDVLKMADMAENIGEQGYLVENPLEREAVTLREGRATARQWAILTAAAGITALFASWVCFSASGIGVLIRALAACAAGVAAAAAVMQPAMLLGLRFFLSPDARYLLNAPRLAIPFAACAAVALLPGLLVTRFLRFSPPPP